jgi:dihydropteroate synthase
VKKVKLVGILNITPDSFSGDGIHDCAASAAAHADELFANGADVVDVGAEATNPWAKPISPDEEWQRLDPVLSKLLPEYPGRLSVDTYHPETVIRIAALFGTDFIVNDVTGMNNPKMREVAAVCGLTCIVSHLPDRFGINIKKAHANAEVDDVKQVLTELVGRRDELVALGLPSEKIILDPGIGFGKTMRLNWDLLQFADIARRAGINNNVLVGYSRKRFLGERRFEIDPNLEAARIAIASGAAYLRVHDVASHYDLMRAGESP